MPTVLDCSVLFPGCSENFSRLLTELKKTLVHYSWEYTRVHDPWSMILGTRYQDPMQLEPRVLVHEPCTREPWSWAPGSNASRTQGIAPWSMIQGSRWLLQQLQDDLGTRIQAPWSMILGTRYHEPCSWVPGTMIQGTRYQDPGTMNHVPGSTGQTPTPPAPPLYVVRLPRAKG